MLRWIDPQIVPQIPAYQWKMKSCAIAELNDFKRFTASACHISRIYVGMVTEKDLFNGSELVENWESATNKVVDAMEKLIFGSGRFK